MLYKSNAMLGEVDISRVAVNWDIVTSDEWYSNMTTTLDL